MYYSDNLDQAGEYLRIALAYISKYSLPPDPLNYTIWYEYASGRNYNLKRAIDYSIKNKKNFDSGILKQFYEKYITNGRLAITEDAIIEIKKIIKNISTCVINTQGELTGHCDDLRTLSKELSKANDLSSLNIVLDKMLNAIKKITKSGGNLNKHISTSSEELNYLRKKLEKAQQASETDVLTGLANRRKFEKKLSYETKKSLKEKTPLSLIMVDIDHFKMVNDNFGHLTGDSVLKTLAALFKRQLKGKDLASRFGGEEFMLMLPETSLEDAFTVAKNLNATLAQKEWKHKASGQSMGKITISLGVAQYKPGESRKAFIERTDRALYTAKQNGRNRVEISST